MFKILEDYYEKCLSCKPCGKLCIIIVNWIEQTQFPQILHNKIQNIGQKIKYAVTTSSDSNKNKKNNRNGKQAPTKTLPTLPVESRTHSQNHDIKIQLNPINFEKPQSVMVERDPDMPAELHMKPSNIANEAGGQRTIQQISMRMNSDSENSPNANSHNTSNDDNYKD